MTNRFALAQVECTSYALLNNCKQNRRQCNSWLVGQNLSHLRESFRKGEDEYLHIVESRQKKMCLRDICDMLHARLKYWSQQQILARIFELGIS